VALSRDGAGKMPALHARAPTMRIPDSLLTLDKSG